MLLYLLCAIVLRSLLFVWYNLFTALLSGNEHLRKRHSVGSFPLIEGRVILLLLVLLSIVVVVVVVVVVNNC